MSTAFDLSQRASELNYVLSELLHQQPGDPLPLLCSQQRMRDVYDLLHMSQCLSSMAYTDHHGQSQSLPHVTINQVLALVDFWVWRDDTGNPFGWKWRDVTPAQLHAYRADAFPSPASIGEEPASSTQPSPSLAEYGEPSGSNDATPISGSPRASHLPFGATGLSTPSGLSPGMTSSLDSCVGDSLLCSSWDIADDVPESFTCEPEEPGPTDSIAPACCLLPAGETTYSGKLLETPVPGTPVPQPQSPSDSLMEPNPVATPLVAPGAPAIHLTNLGVPSPGPSAAPIAIATLAELWGACGTTLSPMAASLAGETNPSSQPALWGALGVSFDNWWPSLSWDSIPGCPNPFGCHWHPSCVHGETIANWLSWLAHVQAKGTVWWMLPCCLWNPTAGRVLLLYDGTTVILAPKATIGSILRSALREGGSLGFFLVYIDCCTTILLHLACLG